MQRRNDGNDTIAAVFNMPGSRRLNPTLSGMSGISATSNTFSERCLPAQLCCFFCLCSCCVHAAALCTCSLCTAVPCQLYSPVGYSSWLGCNAAPTVVSRTVNNQLRSNSFG